VELTTDELDVSIEQAVPIGLIVNELITNSVKHAFGNTGGTVHVQLVSNAGPGVAAVTVSDRGKGFSNDKQTGVGLQLIRALADQIRGRVERESSKCGTITRLTFPPRAA
jgi:two-component system, sensor histidine kinase PdtaS